MEMSGSDSHGTLEQSVAKPPGWDKIDMASLIADCEAHWPGNRALTVVCHGHSVPAGFFQTPEIHSLESYPHLLRVHLAGRFPFTVTNVIVTAIGGEHSEDGLQRFEGDVLTHRPDLLTIDYSLNDRRIGIERARDSWKAMIERSLSCGIRVLLLTPTPDMSARWDDPNDPLNQHAAQVRELAAEYQVGLVDSSAAFRQAAATPQEMSALMAQQNHPNSKGHALVANELRRWFP